MGLSFVLSETRIYTIGKNLLNVDTKSVVPNYLRVGHAALRANVACTGSRRGPVSSGKLSM